MLRGWISNRKQILTPSSSSHSINRLTEIHDLEEALKAANLIFDDDLDGAEEGLAHGQSSFHMLGRGLVQFIRASLGFEADVMQQAADILLEAENASAKDQRRAQKDPSGYQSLIYDAGTEYALCNAMSQLMSAVVAVFRESLVDSMRGFFKLNAAYKTLQKIIESEQAYLERRPIQSARTSPNTPAVTRFPRDIKSAPTSPTYQQPLHIDSVLRDAPDGESDEDNEFYDAEEDNPSHPESRAYAGKAVEDEAVEHLSSMQTLTTAKSLDAEDLQSPTDVFIHAGTNLCFGMLSLVLSLVPPALSKILSLVGYKGDRRKGLRMLWASSRSSNAMGALAGLVLLAYHNGLIGAMDIVLQTDPTADVYSDDNLDGYPAEQLEMLLVDMRQRFPNSKIWIIEQSRMLGVKRDLEGSLNILKTDFESPLKQVEALAVFERSLQAMYSHDYTLCTESFKECCRLNEWSHALYMYTAGVSQVELYRLAQIEGDKELADKHAIEATNLLKEAKDKTGRRKAFGRQLPFDAFVMHKVTKWENRAAIRKIPLIDAVGVSPCEEMIFLWNGFRKMPDSYLKTSLERIAWSESAHNIHWSQEDIDEKALLYLLRAIVLRSLGHHKEVTKVLQDNLLPIDRRELKGANKEDWILPAAHYEMAVNLFEMCHREDLPGPNTAGNHTGKRNPTGHDEHGARNRELMRETEAWLEKAAKWESYMLDARLGMRINSGLDTVKRWRGKWG